MNTEQLSDSGIEIEWLGGNCPVQSEGTVAGCPYYFHARGNRWSFEVRTESSENPVWQHRENYGTWPEAGWITEDEARAFIVKAAALYRICLKEEAALLPSERHIRYLEREAAFLRAEAETELNEKAVEGRKEPAWLRELMADIRLRKVRELENKVAKLRGNSPEKPSESETAHAHWPAAVPIVPGAPTAGSYSSQRLFVLLHDVVSRVPFNRERMDALVAGLSGFRNSRLPENPRLHAHHYSSLQAISENTAASLGALERAAASPEAAEAVARLRLSIEDFTAMPGSG